MPQPNLNKLAAEIRQHLDQARKSLWHYMEAGQGLRTAKELLPHGKWTGWLKANFKHVTPQQAAKYMRIAEPANWRRIEAELKNNPDLGLEEADALRWERPKETIPVDPALAAQEERARQVLARRLLTLTGSEVRYLVDHFDELHADFMHQAAVDADVADRLDASQLHEALTELRKRHLPRIGTMKAIEELTQRQRQLLRSNQLGESMVKRAIGRLALPDDEEEDGPPDFPNRKVGHVASHFLDSGAFTLLRYARRYQQEHKCSQWDFYSTPAFWRYIDAYAQFITRHRVAIDLYANLDVIGNPELTWWNQKYLEDRYHLRPVPVVHYGNDLVWLQRYIDAGHVMIGLGGLVGAPDDLRRAWLDRCFAITAKHPTVKIHGFGVTEFTMMLSYPWWSVDSATWANLGLNHKILIPELDNGTFRFDRRPMTVREQDFPQHQAWLERIGIQAVIKDKDKPAIWAANLLYFEQMRKAKVLPVKVIYFSGTGYKWANPETVLGSQCNLMLSFNKLREGMRTEFRRFKAIRAVRQLDRQQQPEPPSTNGQPAKQLLLLITCCKAKRKTPGRIPARERYIGKYFKRAMKLAEVNGFTVKILSAKLGWIDPDTKIPDYEQRMKGTYDGPWPDGIGYYIGGQDYFANVPEDRFRRVIPPGEPSNLYKLAGELDKQIKTFNPYGGRWQ